MNKYEREIGLKVLWVTLVRRWHVFLMIFVPICLISFITTNFVLTKSYISSITLTKATAFSAAQYSLIQSYIKNTSTDESKPGAVYLTYNKLKEEDFKHKNGSEITMSDIYNGVSFSTLATSSVFISFSFQSPDNTITQKVLSEIAEISIKQLQDTGGSDFKTLDVYTNASTPKKNSKETIYFLIALAAGFVVAFGIPFVDEIVSDEVYDKYDIENLGCSAFEVKAKPKKKEA